jgi:hypothetical protein
MQHNFFCEADSHPASHEFPPFYGSRWFNAVFTTARHRSILLSQMNQVHTLPPYFSKIHFNIILPSTPRSFEWSSLQVFQTKLCVHFSSSPCVLYAPPISFLLISSSFLSEFKVGLQFHEKNELHWIDMDWMQINSVFSVELLLPDIIAVRCVVSEMKYAYRRMDRHNFPITCLFFYTSCKECMKPETTIYVKAINN